MKRHNHPTDLKLYRQVFNIYFDLIDRLNNLNYDQFEIEDLEDEKELCRPQYSKLDDRYLKACDRAGIKINDKVSIEIDGFSCSFRWYEIVTYKRILECKFITPKHHLYYVDVINQTKKVA